jgi:hypothetical protein
VIFSIKNVLIISQILTTFSEIQFKHKIKTLEVIFHILFSIYMTIYFYFFNDLYIKAESIHFAQMDKEKEGPLFYDLFFFYNLFKNGVTIRNVIDMYNPIEKNIDTK